MLLDRINTPGDIKKLSPKELKTLSEEVREYIIDTISKNGGHLASSLGVVELTIALHYVFDAPKDVLIWDVGHQTYAHKILTGRREKFQGIRCFGGLSGFPKVCESEYDSFDVGHSSTSLSLAIGTAVARDRLRKKNKVIAVIGDGSLTGGIAFEALNNIGHLNNDLIIILNDNEHSISKNVGALSEYLTKIITGSMYNKFRRKTMDLVKKIPKIGEPVFNFINRFFESFKMMLVPGQLFEDMGIRYFGPIDGHNIQLMTELLNNVKKINYGPKLIHIITKKGKGYTPAELDPSRFHGIGPFDKTTGISLGGRGFLSYSEVAGKTLANLARHDKKIMALTAAMKLGTGLYEFEKKSPSRFFDVGIAEQHCITFAGALASRGFKPFVSIYSTFMQRAVDQIIHDVALMNLPVKLLIDRSGLVGEDGETHHGLFDIALIRNIPNFVFLAPSSGEELRDMIKFAADYIDGPLAIRYPRGRIGGNIDLDHFDEFVPGKIKRIATGNDVAIFTLGDMVDQAMETRDLLGKGGVAATVVNLLTLKPLDVRGIARIIRGVGGFITLENGYMSGGIGEKIAASVPGELKSKFLFNAGFPDEFIRHGKNVVLFREYGMDPASLAKRILRFIK